VAPPLGASVYAHYYTHVANGEAARMVLYDYDFVPGGAALNCRGQDRLAQIQALMSHNCYPVVVERTSYCPPLADARRLAVLNELGHGPFPTPPERVVIGPPIAIGLQGVEAEIIYLNLLRQTLNRGLPTGAGPAGTGTGAGAVGAAAGAASGLSTPSPSP
jgi:hypothetical protein